MLCTKIEIMERTKSKKIMQRIAYVFVTAIIALVVFKQVGLVDKYSMKIRAPAYLISWICIVAIGVRNIIQNRPFKLHIQNAQDKDS